MAYSQLNHVDKSVRSVQVSRSQRKGDAYADSFAHVILIQFQKK